MKRIHTPRRAADHARLRTRRHLSPQAGLSLTELVMAVLLMFIVVTGILPLFARSVTNNAIGAESTQVSNHSKSRAEQLLQADFNAADLTIQSGDSFPTTDYWDSDAEAFVPAAPTGPARYTRVTTIRQFAINDVLDGDLDQPLPAGTPASQVQLKEIEVRVVGRDFGPLHSRRLVVRTLKSF
jgi:hypothetical protein